MKKIVCAIISLLMVLSLVACGGDGGSQSSSTASGPVVSQPQSSAPSQSETDSSTEETSGEDYVRAELWDITDEMVQGRGFPEYFTEIPDFIKKGVGPYPEGDYEIKGQVVSSEVGASINAGIATRFTFTLGLYEGDSAANNILITKDEYLTLLNYYLDNGGQILAEDGNGESNAKVTVGFDWGEVLMDWGRNLRVTCDVFEV